MKGLLSKEHYYYKIHILLLKSIAYPPPPQFLRDIFDPSPPPPLYDFSKIPTMLRRNIYSVLQQLVFRLHQLLQAKSNKQMLFIFLRLIELVYVVNQKKTEILRKFNPSISFPVNKISRDC